MSELALPIVLFLGLNAFFGWLLYKGFSTGVFWTNGTPAAKAEKPILFWSIAALIVAAMLIGSYAFVTTIVHLT